MSDWRSRSNCSKAIAGGSPVDYELSQRCDTQRVLCCVVVHLTEQHDTVALHRLHQRGGIRVDLLGAAVATTPAVSQRKQIAIWIARIIRAV
jgi:hypothetical protein